MPKPKRRKLSRHAKSTEEIFPGRHGPIQPQVRETMRAVMEALKEGFPGHDITLFIAERGDDLREGARLPRFNYASTAERADMIAVLKAFIAKQEQDGSILDLINRPPASGKQQ